MHCAWIKIDTQRLTLRMWRTRGTWMDVFEVRQWLKGNGCEWMGGQWYACSNGHDYLETDEVLQVQQREKHDGITYVDNKLPPHVLPAALEQKEPT
jgi:hypothetical protein